MPPEAEATDSSVREAALAAMQAAGLGDDNWPQDPDADPTEASQEDTTTEADAEEAATSEVESEEEESEDEAQAAESEEDDSVPKEWFGVDLSEYPSAKRAEIIEAFKEQDRYAQSLNQKLKEKEAPQEEEKEEETPKPVEELDDDALMELLGVSQDDPMYDVKKEIQAPLARIIAQQQQVLSQVQERDAEQQFIAWWESGLNEMEEQFGPLSIDREDLAQIALKEGLRTPQEAYARVALSGRKTVEDLVSKAKEATKEKAKQKKPSTQRPRSDSAQPKKETKLMSPTEAALAAAKESGLDWGEALRGTT